MPNPLTPAVIDAHERLYPRLAALLKQVERITAKCPRDLVPEATVQLAGQLCRQAAKLLGKEGRPIVAALGAAKGPKAIPLDHAGLVVVLAQAVAGLEAFEAAHSGWSAKGKCTVWVIDGPPRPVLRLLPPGSEAKPVEANDPQGALYRGTIHRSLMARYSAGYDAGYRDAKAGIAPQARHCEILWDDLCEKQGGFEEARRAGLKPPRIRYTNPPAHLVPEGAVMSDPKTRQRF